MRADTASASARIEAEQSFAPIHTNEARATEPNAPEALTLALKAQRFCRGLNGGLHR